MRASFHCRKSEKAELPGMGSEHLKKDAKLRKISLCYGMVRALTKENNKTLFLRSLKDHRTKFQKDVSILCISTTSRLSRRHDVSTERCSSSLYRCCTAVLRQKLQKRCTKRAVRIPRPPRLPDLISYEYVLLGHLRDSVFFEHPTTIEELKSEKKDNSNY